MPEIQIEGLGIVEIQGATPNPAEEQAIIRALQERGVGQPEVDRVDPRPMPAPATPGGVSLTWPRGLVRRPGMQPPPVDPTDRLIAQGVGTEGAATPGERFNAGLGVDPLDAAQRALRQRPGFENVSVERDQASGHLLFTHPQTGQRTFFNPPGLDTGDVAGALPDVGVAVAGAGAGVAGGLIAAPAGPGAALTAAALAEAAATSGARYTAFRAGQEAGTVDPAMTPFQLWYRTLPEAAINGLASLGTAAAFRLFRAVAGRHAPNITPEQFDQLWEQARRETAPTGVDPTTAQALRGTPGGDDLLARQDALSRQRTPGGEAVRERLDQQQRAVVGAEERLAGETAPGVDRAAMTPEVAGRRVRGVITAEHDQALVETLRSVEEAASGARRATEVGTTLRSSFQAGQDRLLDLADTAYGAIEREAAGVTGTASNLREFAERRIGQLQDTPTASLFRDQINRLRRLVADTTEEAVAPDSSVVITDRAVNYGRVNQGIAELNRLIRQMDTGPNAAQAAPLINVMREARTALARDRVAMLEAAGRPDLAQELGRVDQWYRTDSAALRRGTVDAILRHERGGERMNVGDASVFDRLVAREEDARLIAELAADPLYRTELAPVREAMRAGFRRRFVDQAVNRENGLVDMAGHRRFMADNEDLMAMWFTPEEVRAFARPGEALVALRRQEQTWRSLIGELQTDASTGRMLRDVAPTPEGVFAAVWPGRDPGVVRHVTGALAEYAQRTGDNAPVEAFRGAVLRDVREHVLTPAGESAIGRDVIDPARLTAYVREHGQALTEALGREYVAGLRQIQVAAERFGAQGRDLTPTQRAGALRHLTRASVGLFTVAGRVMTAGLRTGENAESIIIRRLLLDPEAMRRAVAMRNVTAEEAVSWAVGAGLLADAAREATE